MGSVGKTAAWSLGHRKQDQAADLSVGRRREGSLQAFLTTDYTDFKKETMVEIELKPSSRTVLWFSDALRLHSIRVIRVIRGFHRRFRDRLSVIWEPWLTGQQCDWQAAPRLVRFAVVISSRPMDPRIHEIIDNQRFSQISLNQVAELLTDDDAELDRWLDEAIRTHDTMGFVYLMFAATHRGRKVSSRHLEDGLSMLPHASSVCGMAWHVDGDDVPERLLAGTRRTLIRREIHTAALMMVAAWCREYRDGVFPPDLITEARLLARGKNLSTTDKAMLMGLAGCLGDTRIPEILYPGQDPRHPKWINVVETSGKLYETLLKYGRGPIIALVPETPQKDLTGFTVRRSVDHIGRNEPCRCGSGRKYKRCCFEKDQQRLLMSTAVAGKTQAEIMADPAPYMTLELLEKLSSHDLARIDPGKLDPDLHDLYIMNTCGFGLLDEAVAAVELAGYSKDLVNRWNFVLWNIARLNRRDLAERLFALRADDPPAPEDLSASVRLFLVNDDPAAFLKTFEQMALELMETKDSEKLVGLAYGVMPSAMSGVGILIARAMIPFVKKKDAVLLLDQILETRERLNLSPCEPASDLLDKRFAEEAVSRGKDTEELRVAREKLKAKAEEVRRMQSSLEQLRKEIDRREKKAADAAAAKPNPTPAPPVDAEILRDLREKVRSLKSALKEQHAERATLRRDLNTTLTDLETLREKQAHTATAPHEDAEDHLTLPGDVDGNQPVRVIELPRKFHHTLSHVPRHVARGTMVLLGRLAAGEPDAFVGVVRLKQRPDTLRARIGIDHRLLFRLEADVVHVVDLISRQDFERRIKSL